MATMTAFEGSPSSTKLKRQNRCADWPLQSLHGLPGAYQGPWESSVPVASCESSDCGQLEIDVEGALGE
ncbi:Protein of unknown function [Pyronema omphalodes CBS 100304]|uniref:Uncharacterized protein n=1 Tax=Pyronema omphalodes (strain CBS 100304) TaxID=1076935 RepID=U4KTQ4_PYROM|nr:Protein of unknown function [Pyronema omphalodes CBS 100304]